MRTVALDLGARKIAVCEVSNGAVIYRATVGSLAALRQKLGPNTPPARVLFEAGRSSWRVHAVMKGWGHQPFMLDTTRAKSLGIGHHGRKTDRLDAEVLALKLEKGSIPLAHVLSPHRQELRFQLGVRRTLVESRAQHVAMIREIARARGHMVPSCSTSCFVDKLKAAKLDEATRSLVDPLEKLLMLLDAQIVIVDAKLQQLAAQEPVIRQLQTAPGVGPIVAASFVSVIDEAGRFHHAHQVESYLGLVPSEDSSGGRRRIGSITKQGNRYARAMLVEAAWSILSRVNADDPLRRWGEEIAKRRGQRIAIVAIARRLAGLLWSMWRHDTVYEAARLGRASALGLERQAQSTQLRAAALLRAASKSRPRRLAREGNTKN